MRVTVGLGFVRRTKLGEPARTAYEMHQDLQKFIEEQREKGWHITDLAMNEEHE